MANSDSSVIASDGADHGLAREHRGGVGPLQRLRKQRERPVEHPERDEHADADEGDELDDRLGCDRQHQPVLVLGGVDVAGAEQHGEGRHRQRDEQRDVAEHRLHRAARGTDMHEDRASARTTTALSCSAIYGMVPMIAISATVGGDGLGLAVACGDEVGDRGDVLRLREPHDAHDQR